MLDKFYSGIISYQSADSDVNLRSAGDLSAAQDINAPAEADTAGVVFPADTLDVTLPDSSEASLPDTLDVTLPDYPHGYVSEEDETTGEPIIEVRDELQQTDQIIPASQPESVEKEKVFKYDASYYLNSEPQTLFLSDHLFPPSSRTKVTGPSGGEVFIGNETGVTSESSLEYKAYLQSDIHIKNTDLSYSSLAWMPGLVILSLLLLTWIKVIYIQFLTPVLVSAFNYKTATKLYNEKNAPAQNAFIILHLIFAINAGLFILFAADYFDFRNPDSSPLLFFLGSSIVILLLFAFKSVALTTIGFLFDNSKIFSEYKHNISLYSKIYGIVLLPVVVGIIYMDDFILSELIYTGLILGAAIYLFQLIRGLEIIIKKGVSVFYLILYLCAFEILPILVLYKLFLELFI